MHQPMKNDHDITGSFTAAERAVLGRMRTQIRTRKITLAAYTLAGGVALVLLLEFFILPYFVWPLFPFLNS